MGGDTNITKHIEDKYANNPQYPGYITKVAKDEAVPLQFQGSVLMQRCATMLLYTLKHPETGQYTWKTTELVEHIVTGYSRFFQSGALVFIDHLDDPEFVPYEKKLEQYDRSLNHSIEKYGPEYRLVPNGIENTKTGVIEPVQSDRLAITYHLKLQLFDGVIACMTSTHGAAFLPDECYLVINRSGKRCPEVIHRWRRDNPLPTCHHVAVEHQHGEFDRSWVIFAAYFNFFVNHLVISSDFDVLTAAIVLFHHYSSTPHLLPQNLYWRRSRHSLWNLTKVIPAILTDFGMNAFQWVAFCCFTGNDFVHKSELLTSIGWEYIMVTIRDCMRGRYAMNVDQVRHIHKHMLEHIATAALTQRHTTPLAIARPHQVKASEQPLLPTTILINQSHGRDRTQTVLIADRTGVHSRKRQREELDLTDDITEYTQDEAYDDDVEVVEPDPRAQAKLDKKLAKEQFKLKYCTERNIKAYKLIDSFNFLLCAIYSVRLSPEIGKEGKRQKLNNMKVKASGVKMLQPRDILMQLRDSNVYRTPDPLTVKLYAYQFNFTFVYYFITMLDTVDQLTLKEPAEDGYTVTFDDFYRPVKEIYDAINSSQH